MNKGFTLIELVVATAILMSLTGFGTASYLNFNEKQVLEQAGKNLKNTLRLAQQKAFSGEKDPSNTVCNTQPLDGWCFSKEGGGYKIYGHCGGETAGTAGVFRQQDFPLPSGVSLTVVPDEKLLFGALSKGADREVSYYLKGNFPSLGIQCYKITVKPGGEIIDEGIVTSCP